MTRVTSMVAVFCLNLVGVVLAQEQPFPAYFERLRALVG